jgi:hypothetical protein
VIAIRLIVWWVRQRCQAAPWGASPVTNATLDRRISVDHVTGREAPTSGAKTPRVVLGTDLGTEQGATGANKRDVWDRLDGWSFRSRISGHCLCQMAERSTPPAIRSVRYLIEGVR